MNCGNQRSSCQRSGCGCGCGDNTRERLLWDIQRTDFMLDDLQLYLDNHPDCGAALEDFNNLSQVSMDLKEQFHQEYGPLINFGYQNSELPWQWVDEPWPWERDFMSGR